MKKYLVVVMAVMLLCSGCGNSDTPDTEENTQQMETESSVTDQDEETSSATSETTETEIATEIETEVQTEVENETQTESEVTSEPETPTYTYTDMDKTMYAKSSVNVRDLPSTDGNKLGGLSKAQEVHVTGQCNETNWYRIDYNGGIGYVSGSYLVNDKPVEETPITNSSNATLESCPYELLTLYDDGGKEIVYYYLDDGTNAQVQCLNEAREILRQRGYTKTWTDENGIEWTGACVAWDYVVHEYAEGTVMQCNVFYGEFLNSITGLPEFHGEGVMVPTRY